MAFNLKQWFKRWMKKEVVHATEADSLPGERGIPSVSSAHTVRVKLLIAFGTGAVLLMVWIIFRHVAHHALQSSQPGIQSHQPRGEPSHPIADYSETQPVDSLVPSNDSLKAAHASETPHLTLAQQVLLRKINAPVLFKTNTASNSASRDTVNAHSEGATTSQDTLSGSLVASRTLAVKASILSDRNFLVAKGAHIPCTLHEALDSTLAGMVSCVQNQPLYSDNGKVILLDRGTEYTGEMKQAMAMGQKRVFILWTRAKTPEGVVIELNSPASDALGRTGVDGEIDNHFWDRLGAAILLSLMDDFGNYAIARASQNNSTVITFPNTIQGSQRITDDILKQTINIPPTLRKNQAGQINIYVARDLDFSRVYGLKVNGT